MGSLVSRQSAMLSSHHFNTACRWAADLGFGVAFHMDEAMSSRGNICTRDEIVFGKVWETVVGGTIVFQWGCKFGKFSNADWQLKGSGGSIEQAMVSLTTSMLIMRGESLIRRAQRSASMKRH
jgi:hypothetical protein